MVSEPFNSNNIHIKNTHLNCLDFFKLDFLQTHAFIFLDLSTFKIKHLNFLTFTISNKIL